MKSYLFCKDMLWILKCKHLLNCLLTIMFIKYLSIKYKCALQIMLKSIKIHRTEQNKNATDIVSGPDYKQTYINQLLKLQHHGNSVQNFRVYK